MCGVVGQRRRSRINEKMKALQNLIPNSNKVHKYIRYQLCSLQSLIRSNLLGLIFFFSFLNVGRQIRLRCLMKLLNT